MNSKRKVVLGFLGTQLDKGHGTARWERWRPSVALTQHDDVVIDRFELFYDPQFTALANSVAADICSVSPETRVVPRKMAIADAWDFEQVYASLFDFAKDYPFDTDAEEYWIHITTGTHVVQICMFLMTEARFFPGRLVQTSPPRRQDSISPGSYALIDLDLSRYDQIAQRYSQEQAEGVAFLKSGIATRNHDFNAMIEEIERVAIKSKAPLLLMGPTGAGKSFLARRVFELKRRGTKSTASSSNSIAPPCTVTAPPRHCSVTSRAPLLAPPTTGRAYYAAPIGASCSLMKSVNWDWTNRPCCSRRWRKSVFYRLAAIMRCKATSS